MFHKEISKQSKKFLNKKCLPFDFYPNKCGKSSLTKSEVILINYRKKKIVIKEVLKGKPQKIKLPYEIQGKFH